MDDDSQPEEQGPAAPFSHGIYVYCTEGDWQAKPVENMLDTEAVEKLKLETKGHKEATGHKLDYLDWPPPA